MSTILRFRQLKALRDRRINIERAVKDAFFITLGVAAAGFGLKGFLLPNHFLDGGVMGISLLVNLLYNIDLSILVLVINIPFIIIGYTQVSKVFAAKTLVAIVLLALTLAYIDFPAVTSDKLLIAFFGGFFLGAGIGLSIRGGSVLDGTEILAIFLSRKMHTTIGDFIIIFNIIIFSFAAYLLSVEQALYSIITYLAASKTLDFVVEGIEEYTSVTIISAHNEEIREMIINPLGRAVTIYQGKG